MNQFSLMMAIIIMNRIHKFYTFVIGTWFHIAQAHAAHADCFLKAHMTASAISKSPNKIDVQ